MRGRRRIVEESVNHERWLVSYADFITLLFAFFVVMYSISQVNESKYRVLSDTLTTAFKQSEPRSIEPIQIGEKAKSNPLNLIDLEAMALNENEGLNRGDEQGDALDPLQQLSETFERTFGEMIDSELLNIRGNEQWLEIELNAALLFESGNAQLSDSALGLLGEIIAVVIEQPNAIRIEGFTDNIPINTPLFPSNWALSTARAVAVVQLFVEEGVSPQRLAAVGYGEFQPIADNTTPEGRDKNRRIVLMIGAQSSLRPELPQAAPDPADVIEASANDDPLNGVITVKLPDGGLLFTSQPEPAAEPLEVLEVAPLEITGEETKL